MPVANLLTLVDDIVALLDDVWIMTKVSAQKSAGVLGDDLALNAQQVVGLHPERELPVIAAVAQGSLKNKLLLVPGALALRALAPFLIQPILLAGGLFLCYEGAEKLHHKWSSSRSSSPEAASTPNQQGSAENSEEARISGAVRTDLILSAEIVALTLGLVQQSSFTTAALVLVAVGALMTVGVYGTVALIVKLDDIGLHLFRRPENWAQSLGRFLLWSAPHLLALISVCGTVAVFSVGGGILHHGIPGLHHLGEMIPLAKSSVGGFLLETMMGLLAGAITLAIVAALKRATPRQNRHSAVTIQAD